MAAPDAQLLWLSAAVPNDQFLLYVFDGTPDFPAAVDEMMRNAGQCDELSLRVADEVVWRYPRWVPAAVGRDQFVLHEPRADWQSCLDAVADLAADQLDVTQSAWRAHLFPAGRHTAVVVQIAHSLGDGTRSAALAAALLGRRAPVPPVAAPDRGVLPWRAVVAARAHRGLLRDIDAGLLPPPPASRPVLSVNAAPGGASTLRVIPVPRRRLPGPTVTVGALVAIAEALGGYLADRGEDVSRLGAEVPMALRGGAPMALGGGAPMALGGGAPMAPGGGAPVKAHNNFRNVSVGLYPELPRAARAERIAADLADQRRRSGHPATVTSAAAFAAVPAAVLRWGVRQFDPTARSSTVAGHTVVSSVNRGPADLSIGGCPVLLTAGFPALSPMMSLTHGVHGIGDTVAVSVHADAANVDVGEYVERLAAALDSTALD